MTTHVEVAASYRTRRILDVYSVSLAIRELAILNGQFRISNTNGGISEVAELTVLNKDTTPCGRTDSAVIAAIEDRIRDPTLGLGLEKESLPA
jgi:hypothetical protein